MSGILRRSDAGLEVYLLPTVEFCGSVSREFVASYDSTGSCDDVFFRMEDPLSIADLLAAFCLQTSQTAFRSPFVSSILETSISNLEVITQRKYFYTLEVSTFSFSIESSFL